MKLSALRKEMALPDVGLIRAAEDLNRTKRQAEMPSAWGLELDLGLFWPFKAD